MSKTLIRCITPKRHWRTGLGYSILSTIYIYVTHLNSYKLLLYSGDTNIDNDKHYGIARYVHLYILLHTTQLQGWRTGSSTRIQQTTTICRHMVTRQVVVQNHNIEQCHIIIAICRRGFLL